MDNINKLHNTSVICDNKYILKSFIETDMVSTSKVFTGNNPIEVEMYGTTNNPSVRKSLHHFYELFDFKQIKASHKLGFAKVNHNAINKSTSLWLTISREKGYTNITDSFKFFFITELYNIHRFFSP